MSHWFCGSSRPRPRDAFQNTHQEGPNRVVTMATITELEQLWELIEQGNNHHDAQDLWKAAECYFDAQETLKKLSSEESLRQHDSEAAAAKVATLYRQQAWEYCFRARETLVEALKRKLDSEKDKFSDSSNDFPLPVFASDDTGQGQLLLFGRLFWCPEQLDLLLDKGSSSTKILSSEQLASAEFSIEQRLAQLNQNLPIRLQSTEQRMNELNKGLNRLGLSNFYDTSNRPTSVEQWEPPKSTSDQVNDIIAQAKDEVTLLNQTTNVVGSGLLADQPVLRTEPLYPSDSDDDDSSTKSHAASSVSDAETPRFTRREIETIRDKVADAQTQLAQLLVMLEIDDGTLDMNDNDDGEEEVVRIDAESSQHFLRQASIILKETRKLWRR